jgi:hypothetical protein
MDCIVGITLDSPEVSRKPNTRVKSTTQLPKDNVLAIQDLANHNIVETNARVHADHFYLRIHCGGNILVLLIVDKLVLTS